MECTQLTYHVVLEKRGFLGGTNRGVQELAFAGCVVPSGSDLESAVAWHAAVPSLIRLCELPHTDVDLRLQRCIRLRL